MQKYDVQMALERLREARDVWRAAKRVFETNTDKVLNRLILEGAANYMSVEEVARYSGFTPLTIRRLMTRLGMNAEMRKSKRLLAKTAAEALASNADLLGIAPHEMDLMSPLAYLPMGSELRQQITDQTVSKVTEFPETEDEKVERLTEVFKEAWHSRDEYWRTAEGTGLDSQSDRTQAGIRAVLKAMQ